ncbi:TVP38/TMEM64 family protein [Paenibacillus methanolicus]|uniref:TVP38/TMEM64 family membrane protein n=1 Tax=Paenibacillus methanolicus TaxID=582686 RepID=A0A5S5CBP8_9BACL|nr:TVP38/TMEM64 family protein [Paenibacillus methanolicus]TYP75423.1 putative membrane protein YdjX (TVP38/TMEM64 family) [Paenibacillus methanolicus]
MAIKMTAALLYLAAGLLLCREGEAILAWLQGAENLLLAAGMAVLFALFPVMPYPIIGGILGAAYGPALGGLVTWIGSWLASMIMFVLVRRVYRGWGERVLRRHGRAGKLTVLFERNAFLAILFARLVPFVPSVLVNAYAALSQARLSVYAAASALGKVPSMLLFALLGDRAMTEPSGMVLVVLVYGAFLVCTLGAYRVWQRRAA